MLHRCLTVIAAVLLSTQPSAASAQASASGRLGLSPAGRAVPITWHNSLAARDSVPPNQWVKGAIIGAAAGAILGVSWVLLHNSIADTNANVLDVLWPMGILGLLGGLIGSFSRKH